MKRLLRWTIIVLATGTTLGCAIGAFLWGRQLGLVWGLCAVGLVAGGYLGLQAPVRASRFWRWLDEG